MIGRYLDELAREAGKSLSSPQVDALLVETQAHFEDDVQARLELGMEREEAEREALAALGTAKVIGGEVRRRAPRIDRAFLLCSVGVVLSWGLMATARSDSPDWVAPVVIALATIAHMGFIVASVYARRVQAVALAAVLVPLWLGWSVKEAVTHAYVELPTAHGIERTHRDWVGGSARELRDWAGRIRRNAATLKRNFAAFHETDSTLSPSRRASYMENGTLRFFRRADHTQAEAYWRAAIAESGRHDEALAARNEAQAQVLVNAERAAWWPNVPSEIAWTFLEPGWGIAVAYGAVHLLAWLMGQTLRRRGRGRRGTLA